jgi:hypothetical protein
MAPCRKFLSESLKEISVPPNLECQDQGEEEANTAQEKVSGRTFELKLDKKISRKGLNFCSGFSLKQSGSRTTS